MGRNCSTAQKTDLLHCGHKLEARISSYEQHTSYIMKLDNDIWWYAQYWKLPELDPQSGNFWWPSHQLSLGLVHSGKGMNSASFGIQTCQNQMPHPGWHCDEVETELHKGQINDSLDSLYLVLGEKLLCFQAEVRKSGSQYTTNWAWDNIHKFDTDGRWHKNIYNHTQNALERLSVEQDYLKHFRISQMPRWKWMETLQKSTYLGNNQTHLPGSGVKMNNWSLTMISVHTCRSVGKIFPIHWFSANLCPVYHVIWLRDRACNSQWEEEVWLVDWRCSGW